MKVKLLSLTKEIGKKLVLLEENVANLIYPVGLNIHLFHYEGDGDFDMDNLKEIYPDDVEHMPFTTSPADFEFSEIPLNPVAGRIQNVSFEYVKTAIRFYFSTTFTGEFVYELVDKETLKKSTEEYWQFVGSLIRLPPSASFEHLPSPGSLFDIEGARWKFCFVLLNDDQKKGVLISGFGIR